MPYVNMTKPKPTTPPSADYDEPAMNEPVTAPAPSAPARSPILGTPPPPPRMSPKQKAACDPVMDKDPTLVRTLMGQSFVSYQKKA